MMVVMIANGDGGEGDDDTDNDENAVGGDDR